ncbi:MAG: VBCS repeat-containing protein [Rhodospirillaceae bacterium]|nr:MAG: VBCS repeat-containing protein [Rhodospirillaceae bacterium]
MGGEFQVNTYTTDWQEVPSVTGLNDGGFVVTWMSDGQDGNGGGIYGQRYAADGTATGGEFQVNTVTTDWQGPPSVTALNDGGFVVTWGSNGQDGNGYGVYGQRYAADGTVAGVEFQVNTYTTDHQYYPSVTALKDGGFVVTWQSWGQDGEYSGVYGRRYAANGTAGGGVPGQHVYGVAWRTASGMPVDTAQYRASDMTRIRRSRRSA